MKKVTIACFCVNESNSGDRLYVETIEKVFKHHASGIQVELCDFYARTNTNKQSNEEQSSPITNQRSNEKSSSVIQSVYRKIVPYSLRQKRTERIEKEYKYSEIRKYYEKKLENASALIIPGGGLVEFSSWRDYYILMEMLLSVCRQRNINVYINSIGYVANEEPKKWVKRWKNILNDPSVKDFSCRDNLAFFKKIKKDAKQVPCLACLASDYFGIYKADESNTIGLGVMRFDAFSDYGNNFGKKDFLDYYQGIINALLEKGYKVALFSVGVYRDQRIGKELAEKNSNPNVTLLERPDCPEDLLRQVAGFKGIITVRTHSAYAAFSLNVPAVMIYFGIRGWSGKSKEFMRMMGRPQNAVCCDNLSPDELVEKFENAVADGWNQEIREKMLKCAQDNILRIINEISESD